MILAVQNWQKLDACAVKPLSFQMLINTDECPLDFLNLDVRSVLWLDKRIDMLLEYLSGVSSIFAGLRRLLPTTLVSLVIGTLALLHQLVDDLKVVAVDVRPGARLLIVPRW